MVVRFVFQIALVSISILNLFGVTQAQEETPLAIAQLEIALWPEYDDPRLLVIYRGELAEDPKGSLTFAIPASANVLAAAHHDESGKLLADEWQVFPGDGGQQLLAFAPRSRQFQFEYYMDMTANGSRKSFAFGFQSSRYDVKGLQIEFRQPLGASGLQATPELQAQGTDAQGFIYFNRKVGSVPRETLVEQSISYVRADAQPSVKVSNGKVDFAAWPWQIIGGVAALTLSIMGFVWILWARQRTSSPKTPERRRLKNKKPAPLSASTSSASIETKFCIHCGREFQPEERFCPQCGTSRG